MNKRGEYKAYWRINEGTYREGWTEEGDAG